MVSPPAPCRCQKLTFLLPGDITVALKGLSGFGQFHSPPRSEEKCSLQLSFEISDSLGYTGLADVKLFCGMSNRVTAGNSQKRV
jgi:hypothetical protein